MRYRCNMWVQSYMHLIRPQEWAKCSGEGITEDDLMVYPCCGGLDLALIDDSTAWVLCWQLPNDVYAFKAHHFLPMDGIVDKERHDGVPYRAWEKDGYYSLTRNMPTTDFGFVMQRIRDDCEKYDVREIAVDPYRAQAVVKQLGEKEGLPIFEMMQGFITMGEPTSTFISKVKNTEIAHFDDPVLKWMAGNVVGKYDPKGNLMMDKKLSKRKIDGMVAAVMAYGRARFMKPKKTAPTMVFFS